jgi:hypothetical protein
MIDFYKVRQYTDECNQRLDNISKVYNIDVKYLKRLCQEIGFQTREYTYSEAIDLVSNDLSEGMDINKIILKYNLDKSLI